MSYEEATTFLNNLGIDAMKSMKPSLKRIQAICEALNHPELAIPAIHITGTNGKSSTARITTSLLGATGLTVGTYTSPHLESVRERIALSGEPLDEETFGEMFEHLRPYITLVEARLGEKLTYFEVLTALFFFWAAEAPVDALVVEVGLGGRWDATNVVPAPVAVITNIARDHTALLGDDPVQIAGEKAGIIKANAAVVTAERSPDPLGVIRKEVDANGAGLWAIDRDFSVDENIVAVGGRYLTLTSSARSYEGLFLPLNGAHQGTNAAVALEAVTRFLPVQDLDPEIVQAGLAEVEVAGRLEMLTSAGSADPNVVLDVAHNPEGMSALVTSLLEGFAFDEIIFVVGILADKDHEGMLSELTRIPGRVFLTEARSVRSASPSELAEVGTRLGLTTEVIEGVPAAVSSAVQAAGPDTLVCVTGSHYIVGEARTFLTRPEPPD